MDAHSTVTAEEGDRYPLGPPSFTELVGQERKLCILDSCVVQPHWLHKFLQPTISASKYKMTNVFISFPPGGGGNHMRNVITVASNFIDNQDYHQSILDQYTGRTFNVHGNDLASTALNGNINSFKLHNATLNDSENRVFYGHFAEFMSLRKEIASIKNKKFILLSIDTENCKKIWLARSKEIGQNSNSYEYYMGEQVFLYESSMYANQIFNCKPINVINVGLSEWLNSDISNVLNRIEMFLSIKFDRDKVQAIHNKWVELNKKFL